MLEKYFKVLGSLMIIVGVTTIVAVMFYILGKNIYGFLHQ